jgi:hypothetical protein
MTAESFIVKASRKIELMLKNFFSVIYTKRPGLTSIMTQFAQRTVIKSTPGSCQIIHLITYFIDCNGSTWIQNISSSLISDSWLSVH